jgi:predicted enzyme related to lactoylglutathione lyase
MRWELCCRDDNRYSRPKNPALSVELFQKTDDKPSQYPSVVIQVDDMKEHMTKVESGGKVWEPWNIPGVGLYVSFLDTEGNRVSMLQPSM